MSGFNHTQYFYDVHTYDCSYEAFDSESTRVASEKVDDETTTKTNHLRRTSSLTDIRNLPGPSETTTHHPPPSPSSLSYLDLWDENAFPPVDIPLPEPPIASQPAPSTLRPLYSRDFDALEGSWVQGDLSLAVPELRDPQGIWEVSPLNMDADIDGVHGSRVLAEVRYLKPSDAPLEPDFLGESEYMRACRQLELQQPARNPLSEPLDSPFARAPIPSVDDTTAALSSSKSGAREEPPRRSRRRVTPPTDEDTPTTATSSSKGKGKEVPQEPAASSTPSTTLRKSKRKREDAEDVPAIAEADSAPPSTSKKQRMTSEEVEDMMVLPEPLPTECGCGTEFAEPTVPSIVDHFAIHYSDEERAGRGKLQCRWGECEKELTYGELVRHVKGDHVGARWPCADCGQLFTRPNGVTRHKKSESACRKNQAVAGDRRE